MPYQQTTLAELQATLKASWDSSPFWTDAEATKYLNHGLRLWNLLTGMWKKKVVLTTTAGEHYLQLPGAITYAMQVVWGPTGRALQPSALQDLDMGRPRWEEETTASGGDVAAAPTLWAPSGMTELAIWPADAIGSRQILVDGVAETPVLALPGDYIDMGDQDATALGKFALHIACFKRGAPAVKTTQSYFAEFIQAAMQQNERLRYSSYFRKYTGLDFQKGMKPIVNTKPQGGQQGGQPGQGQGQGQA